MAVAVADKPVQAAGMEEAVIRAALAGMGLVQVGTTLSLAGMGVAVTGTVVTGMAGVVTGIMVIDHGGGWGVGPAIGLGVGLGLLGGALATAPYYGDYD